MEIRERTPEQKLERYQAMLFVCIANEMRMKSVLQGIAEATEENGATLANASAAARQVLADLEPIPGMGKR